MFKNQKQLKTKLLSYISTHSGTSFAELNQVLDSLNVDYRGDLALSFPKNPNLVLWTGLNEDAATLYNEVVSECEMLICNPYYYMVDGEILNLPIAKTADVGHYKYSKDHWLPIVLNLKDKSSKSCKLC